MTRKHFDLIAGCLGAAQAEPDHDPRTLHDIGRRLAVELLMENPRFDADRFWTRVEYWRQQELKAP